LIGLQIHRGNNCEFAISIAKAAFVGNQFSLYLSPRRFMRKPKQRNNGGSCRPEEVFLLVKNQGK